MANQVSVRLTADERKMIEAIGKTLADRGAPATLSTLVRSVAINALMPSDTRPLAPRGHGKNFARTEYLKERPEMAGTRRRAPTLRQLQGET